jgi:hypothetical protein
MKPLFVLVFYSLFAMLSLGYYLVQRRRAAHWKRLLWLPVYLVAGWLLNESMFWSNNYFYERGVVFDWGHASLELVLIFFSWCLLALVVVVVSFLATQARASKVSEAPGQ